ncbi:PREDICTED: DUF724 domain-containing [Prunus dulcis]|uniref:PREDICTED: DUF724 domain-containing n=1 Tax=Prunus dulcis TaxID=3755 RepID=A0A5E4G2K1_PRUDU|nr:PREDICTED: DUF724 domain-containing [Prunus dulcis]
MVKRRRRSEAHLSKDSKVEVRSNEEGYRGAWFPAFFIFFFVEGSEVPPPTDNPDQPFEPADVVDASYIDVWWVGVVMRCEDDKSDLLELKSSELRPHWDFLKGKWVRPRKKRMVGSVFSPGTAVEVNLSKEHIFGAWLPAIYLGELGDNSTMRLNFDLSYCRSTVAESTLGKTKSYEDAMVEAEIEDSAMDIETIIEGSSKLLFLLGNPAGISNKQNEVGGREVETGVTGSEEMMRETKTVDSARDYLTKEVQVAVTGISATASTHDQPLSLCIDEMHSVKAIECSSNPAGTAKQQNEDGGAQVGQPHFPFVRNFPISPWKDGKLCLYGGEDFQVASFGNPRDLFDSILEALADLEMLGFDVKAVWDHLKELLEMKVKLGQLQNRSQEVDIQITAYSPDRTRNNETISRIDKDIKDLQEKRATLMSIDAAKGSEICKLQSKANAITEGIRSIHCDFEKLDVTAW